MPLPFPLDVAIRGDAAVIARLERLPARARGKLIRQWARPGAKQALAEMQARMPVDEGELRSDGKVRATKSRRRGALIGADAIVGDRLPDGYASFVEFGREGQEPQPYQRPTADRLRPIMHRRAITLITAAVRAGVK